MEIALQIYHLDDNEADKIVSILDRKPLPSNWFVERPTDETNSVLVRFRRNDAFEPEVAQRDFLFDRSTELLSVYEKSQMDEIKMFDLNITLRIMTKEFALPLPSKLLGECGRLGIDLYVFVVNE